MSSAPNPTDPLTTGVKILGIVAIVALGWSAYQGWSLGRHGKPLQTSHAPRRIVSLALAPTTADARSILGEWRCGEPDPRQRRARWRANPWPWTPVSSCPTRPPGS